MPSKHLRAAPWAAALFAIIVAGMVLDSRGSAPLVAVAVVLTVTAAWLELTERIDDDT
ncbi:hypothetical protein PQI66_09895 [Corynebacterium sp. USCH3]|uniref:hypothetical protein n=1 Tax=Corynebacterium sp. USCH3 TaxID=3024840 RepID=UPI0030A2B34F